MRRSFYSKQNQANRNRRAHIPSFSRLGFSVLKQPGSLVSGCEDWRPGLSLPSVLGVAACLEPVLNRWMFGGFPVFYAWSCREESVPSVFLTGVCGTPEVNER